MFCQYSSGFIAEYYSKQSVPEFLSFLFEVVKVPTLVMLCILLLFNLAEQVRALSTLGL
jgi:hypothetical protein